MTYYTILEVEITATSEEIEIAYKRQAFKKHPDRGGTIEDFQKLQEAYAVLSDPNKRKEYDTTGKFTDISEKVIMGFVDIVKGCVARMYDDNTDLKTMVVGTIKNTIVTLEQRKIGHQHQINKTTNIKNKIRPTTNIMVAVLDNDINNLKSEIYDMSLNIDILNKILLLTNDFEYILEEGVDVYAKYISA